MIGIKADLGFVVIFVKQQEPEPAVSTAYSHLVLPRFGYMDRALVLGGAREEGRRARNTCSLGGRARSAVTKRERGGCIGEERWGESSESERGVGISEVGL